MHVHGRAARWFRSFNARLGQRGQSMVEYLLILMLAFGFARFIYFNQQFGIQPNFEKMMLGLGSYLEASLKSGTRPGGQGYKQADAFAGTSNWKN
jgi:hypothetical protein